MENENNEIEVTLCEVPYIFLKPNVLYRFVAIEGCAECKRLEEAAKG